MTLKAIFYLFLNLIRIEIGALAGMWKYQSVKYLSFAAIIFFLSTGTSLVAQPYFPLLKIDKVWLVEYTDQVTIPPVIEQRRYRFQGDTLIGAMTYGDYGYGVLLREDTVERKVYQIEAGNTQECVLYDFSAQVGDTIDGCQFQVIVDSIATVMLNDGTMRKIYYYRGGIGEQYWIEGIGARGGLIEITELIGPPTFDLLCVNQAGMDIYGEQCGELTTSQNLPQQEVAINVFPNPALDYLQITSDILFTSYRIRLSTGLVYKTGSLLGSQLISITDLKPGYYFIALYGYEKEQVAIRSFVKSQ